MYGYGRYYLGRPPRHRGGCGCGCGSMLLVVLVLLILSAMRYALLY